MTVPFAPNDGGTVTVAASTTSADEAIDPGQNRLNIVNTTNGVAHVKTAQASALTATTADFPVDAGETAIITIGSTHNIVAVILAAGAASGNVYVTPGVS